MNELRLNRSTHSPVPPASIRRDAAIRHRDRALDPRAFQSNVSIARFVHGYPREGHLSITWKREERCVVRASIGIVSGFPDAPDQPASVATPIAHTGIDAAHDDRTDPCRFTTLGACRGHRPSVRCRHDWQIDHAPLRNRLPTARIWLLPCGESRSHRGSCEWSRCPLQPIPRAQVISAGATKRHVTCPTVRSTGSWEGEFPSAWTDCPRLGWPRQIHGN
jgi:hypothetical protein